MADAGNRGFPEEMGELVAIDTKLSQAAKVIARKGLPSDEALSLIGPLARQLNLLLRALSLKISICRDHYDEIVSISAKWRAYVAYHGGAISPNYLGPDKSLTPAARAKEVTNRRAIIGRVVSASMGKTVTVEVVYHKRHSQYGKSFRTRKKFLVHDEREVCNVGDIVVALETRPLSKRKRHRLFRRISAV